MKREVLIVVGFILCACAVRAAELRPYEVDEHTLILAHFDQSASPDYAKGTDFAAGSNYALKDGRFGKAIQVFEGRRIFYKGDDGNINMAEGTIEFWLKPDWAGDDESSRSFMSISVGKNNYINLNKAESKLGGGICGPDKTKKEGFTYYRFDHDCSRWKKGEWHHYALSWGSGELHFYIDGKEVDSSNEIVSPSGLPERIQLHGFGGLMDELRISDIQRRPFSQGRAVALEDRTRSGVRVKSREVPACVWSLLIDDVDGDGKDEFILGGVNHYLYLEKNGHIAWKYDLDGIAYDLACGDVDGDGKKEIGACSFDPDGNFYLFRTDGTLVGKFSVGLPFMGVAMTDLDSDGKAEIILGGGDSYVYALDSSLRLKWKKTVQRRIVHLRVDDLDGDGKKEIVLSAQGPGLICLNNEGEQLWRSRACRAACGGATGNLVIADINEDGKKEIIAGGIHPPVSLVAVDCLGGMIWSKSRCGLCARGARPVGVADLTTDRGKEIMAFDQVGGTFHLLSSDGRLLKALEDVRPPFGLCAFPGKREIWASSFGCRDKHIHRITIDNSGADELPKLSRKTPMEESAERLYESVRRAKVRAIDLEGARVQRKFHPLINFGASAERIVKHYHDFLKPMNSDHVEFQVYVTLGKKETRRQLFLDIAKACEKNEVPVRFWIAHGCKPRADIELVKDLLKAAPTYCRGFNVGENYAGRGFPHPHWQEFLDYLEQLLDVCAKNSKTLIVEEMFDSWVFIPIDRVTYSKLFKPRYKSVLIPMIRSNNAHCTELQTGSIIGLWQAGLVEKWGISSQNWNWTWDQQLFMPVLCPDDIVLRMDIAAASLGATYFHVEGYFQPFYEYGPTGLEIHPRAKRHRALLYELMRKNIILPAEREQLVNISPVCFRLVRGEDRDYAYDWYRGGGTRQKGIFDFKFCMQATSGYYGPSYLYSLRHYFEGLFPATPYGFIRLFPEPVELSRFKDVKGHITTDGSKVYKDHEILSAAQARPFIENEFRKASAALPFKAEGVFLSAQKWGKDYLVYLIDPGYLSPSGPGTELTINLSGEFDVEDWLTTKAIRGKKNRFSVEVPAGSFRILRVRRK